MLATVVRCRVLVQGHVQGVWFRDTCRRHARELGVHGWVRNTEHGSVEAVFEGEPGPVSQMVAWCQVGPPGAQVSGIEVTEEEPVGEHGFRITH